jgi:phosphoglycolate phosphatase
LILRLAMQTKLVILDLDGTLIDSLDDLTDAANHMRRSFDLPAFSAADVRRLVGEGARRLVERALPDASANERERGLEIFLLYNYEHIADKTFFYPGVCETLEKLAANGLTLTVASNKGEAHCREILRLLNGERYFAAILGADSVAERKPSPEPIFHLMRQFGCNAAETVMVGDSSNDVRAGKGAGVVTIGCDYGYGVREELEPADYVINSFPELLEVIAKG